MQDRIATCFEIATEAAEVARRVGNAIVETKAPGNYVTAGDVASQAFIKKEIRRRFRRDAITSEERKGSLTGSSEYHWLADPVDGTQNFVKNMGPWAVSLAVLQGNRIVAGCVVEGTTRDVFTASVGQGARRNGKPIRVSTTPAPRSSLAAFDCPYFRKARMTTTYAAFGELLRVSASVRCYGSCAVALCMIAAGELDVYAVEHGKSWDFAAGTLLVHEAGGLVTTWAGRSLNPYRPVQVLATNGVLHYHNG